MSSLPSWVASAFAFSEELNTIATTAPPMRKDTGATMSKTNTMMIGPKSTTAFLRDERPSFDFDERADR